MPVLYSFDPVDPRAFDLLAWYNLAVSIGCVFWIAAYVLFIRQGFRDRAPALPLTAICLNLAWETLTSLVFPDPVPLWRFVDRAWLLIDGILLYQLLRYGPELAKMPEVKRHFRLIVGLTYVLGLVGQYTFVATYRDRIGLMAAFMINLVMSVLFIFMALERREDGRGLSVGAAVCKMLGTLGNAVGCHVMLRYLDPELPNLWFLTFLGATTLAADALYTALAMKLSPRSARDVPALAKGLVGS